MFRSDRTFYEVEEKLLFALRLVFVSEKDGIREMCA